MTKGGSSQRNRGGGATPRKVISIGSITQDVTLHKAESAWKPGRKQEQAEVVDDDTKKQRSCTRECAVFSTNLRHRNSKLW